MKILLFFSLITMMCFPGTDLPHIPFDSIDFTTLQPIKFGYDYGYFKTVYFNETDQLYIKIWDAGYRRSINFLKALHVGFFDNLTTLVALIYDDSCRGYITKAGYSIADLDPAIVVDIIGQREALVPLERQINKAYINFYHQLIENTKKTGYVYIDLTTANIITLHNNIYLIDLESVDPLRGINKFFFLEQLLPIDYRNSIRGLQPR